MTDSPPAFAVRYPFLSEGRSAVQEADVDAPDMLTPGEPVAERAVERVELAMTEGRVGDPAWDARAELLSYPAARVLVSLLAEREATIVPAYAHAEAVTFAHRVQQDHESERAERSIEDFAEAVGLSPRTGEEPGSYYMPVTAFLSHAPDADGWELSGRKVQAGSVRVAHGELLELLTRAAADRVGDDLPYDVPKRVSAEADPLLAELEHHVERSQPAGDFEAVRPGQMPPCLSEALEALREGDDVPPPAEVAVMQCLAEAGMDPGGISDLLGGTRSEVSVAHVTARVSPGGDMAFVPPDCEAMDAYGLCEPIDRCDGHAHPFDVYAAALADR